MFKMKKFLYIILLCLLPLIISFDVPPELQSVCPQGCNRYDYCSAELGKCVYKGFFPIYPLELIELLLMMTSSALATACGIGGGTVYSSIILGVQGFLPSRAFPIANFLILCCGFVTYIESCIDKYENPTNKFVNYDIAIIFGPSMLLGAKFGTIINKVFPTTLLMIGLLILLCNTIYKTDKNIKKAKLKEELLLKKKDEQISNNITEPSLNLTESRYNYLHDDERPINWSRIIFICILEIIVILDQFIEGNSKLPSFIGITRGSFYYWLAFFIYILISLIFIQIAIITVKHHIAKKKEIDPNYKSEIMENVNEHIIKVILIAILAGIISSSLGIGGGMITNPVFASLGLDPKESSSTSNFLIITTAIASTFLFSFAGQLDVNFSIAVGIPCSLAALCGSFFILKYINKTGRSSILLVLMQYFLVASLFIAIYKAGEDFYNLGIGNLIQFNSYN